MDALLGLMDNLTNPDWIVTHGGLYLLLFIIFAETGIMIGFFLPGDPILFIAGIIISNMSVAPGEEIPLLLYWILLISIAAILGNFVGYWCGRLFGNRILNMKDTWLFRREYIYKAQEFYDKQGGSAIILARFLPVVRTFAPIVAGIVGMNFRKFVVFNILGAFIWTGSLVTLGFLLGENQWVQKNLELVIFLIVAAATAPVIFKAISGKRKSQAIVDTPSDKESIS